MKDQSTLSYFRTVLVVFVLTTSLSANGQEIWQYPYQESFDAGLGIWTNVIGDDGSWATLGSTPNTIYDNRLPTVFHGDQYAYCLYSGAYVDDGDVKWLISPTFVLDNIDSASLSFAYWPKGNDQPFLAISISINGSSWERFWIVHAGQVGWQSASIQLHELFDDYDRRELRVKFRLEGGITNVSGSTADTYIGVDLVELKDVSYGDYPPLLPARDPLDVTVVNLADNYSGSSGAEGYYSSYSHSRAFDNSSSSYWYDRESNTFIQYTFDDDKRFSLTSYNLMSNSSSYGPRDWTLYGSNDGSNWDAIDSRENVSWSTDQTRSLDLPEPSLGYNSFRLFIEDSNSSYTQLTEIDLFGIPVMDEPAIAFPLRLNSSEFQYSSGVSEFDDVQSKAWIIQPMDGSNVVLNFQSFETQNPEDELRIYDGENYGATLIGIYTGSQGPTQTIVSAGNSLYLEYLTLTGQTAGTGAGFEASYQSGNEFGQAPNVWVEVDTLGLMYDGKVGIGTDKISEDYDLSVNGKIRTEEVKVYNNGTWADFVFQDDYQLVPLAELETFIANNHHLPEIPSTDEVANDGISLGAMNALLLQKIEELTLYIIEQNKRLELLETKTESATSKDNP